MISNWLAGSSRSVMPTTLSHRRRLFNVMTSPTVPRERASELHARPVSHIARVAHGRSVLPGRARRGVRHPVDGRGGADTGAVAASLARLARAGVQRQHGGPPDRGDHARAAGRPDWA